MTTSTVPRPRPTLLAEQLRPAVAMLAGGAWSLVPSALRRRVDPVDRPVRQRVSTGSDELLDAHAAWAGAPPDRHAGTVPPHTFARWAMPAIARLTARAPLPLLQVLNQGVDVEVLQPIPRGVPLDLTGRFAGVVEEPTRTRVDTSIEVALPDGTTAMRLQVYAVVPNGGNAGRRRDEPAHDWAELGSFAAEGDDGKRFFWLTGDFNPIHTVDAVGRLTRFDGCILHGFGTMARTWEVAVDAGLDLRDVQVRFVAPNPLPNPRIVVERAQPRDVERSGGADDEGRTLVRARGIDGTTYLAARIA